MKYALLNYVTLVRAMSCCMDYMLQCEWGNRDKKLGYGPARARGIAGRDRARWSPAHNRGSYRLIGPVATHCATPTPKHVNPGLSHNLLYGLAAAMLMGD